MSGNILTVSGLNRYVKGIIEGDKNLEGVLVKGELSGVKVYPSGHCYFTLKDSTASVKAVMFKWSLQSLRFKLKDGMSVILQANTNLYEATGSYQLNVTSVVPEGEGVLALQFEQLKQKLTAEGLFDNIHKKPLPQFPKRICVVTSSSGAVINDIKTVISRRYPLVTITLIHSSVQGEAAARELVSALRYADSLESDCIIIGRGGGSMEDLHCFNDENLVREISRCKTPVISAVGHESDFTLCDFVADVRGATPSAAAELATPDIRELYDMVLGYEGFLKSSMTSYIDNLQWRVNNLEKHLHVKSPSVRIERYSERVRLCSDNIHRVMNGIIEKKRLELISKSKLLGSLNPLEVLMRGYSYTVNDDDRVITSVSDISKGDLLTINLADGALRAKVESIRKKRSKK